MKMKAKYIYQVGAFLLGSLIFSGCIEWEEFEPLDLASAPTVSVVQGNVSDSVIVVNVTSSADGFVAAILLEGTGNSIPLDSTALLKGNVEYLAYAYGPAEANSATALTFASSVQQNSAYEVMVVAANADGVVSDVEVIEITTTDTYPPSLLGASPAIDYAAVVQNGDTLVLVFDEPVLLGDGKFTFETFYTGQEVVVPDDNIWAAGPYVFIVLPADFPYREYLWLHWEAGAVTDLVGNAVDEWTTFYDGEAGEFVGVFWRMAAFTYAVESVTPDPETAQMQGFDIVLTYGGNVSIANVEDGDITLTYDDGAGIISTVDVPAADVSAAGAEVTIQQNVFTILSGTVTINVPAGLITVGIGNPTAEYTETWTIEVPQV
jgi:hypothetical protein